MSERGVPTPVEQVLVSLFQIMERTLPYYGLTWEKGRPENSGQTYLSRRTIRSPGQARQNHL